jgi:peptidoglycan/xylan/chitin deacetylase (PgdA/CDA1 family)
VALANGLTMSHKTHYPAADYYQDAHQIPTWARANVMSATVNNLVANYPNKKYIRASKPATRGEVAVAFYRILAAANKQVYTYQNPYLITCAKIPPVLMYHEIIDQPKYSSDVSTANFGLQMQWLHQAGYTTLKLDEFYEAITQHKVLPEKSILITFDDVYIGNYTIARPILQQYNMQAAFFAHTAFVGASTGAHAKMNWAQLAEMHQLFEVESHTHTHQNLAALSAAEINQELSQSQIALRDRLNKNSRYITYPYGGYNAEVLATAANYYAMGFAVAFKGFEGAPMAYSVPRIPVGTGVGNLTTFKALIESYDY